LKLRVKMARRILNELKEEKKECQNERVLYEGQIGTLVAKCQKFRGEKE